MKDYYEILEVNKKASKEVIDKAYKVLAKKYHPDLQKEENKLSAKTKMQEVNEAYEVLSNDEKRKEYDIELERIEKQKIEEEVIKKQQYQQEYEQNVYKDIDENEQYDNTTTNGNYTIPFTKKQIKEQEKREKAERKRIIEEEQARYRNYLRSMGYRVKEKWTWKRFFKLLKALLILAIAFLIIWIFPPTNKLLKETYNENPIVQSIVRIIGNIFIGIFKGIGAFFKQIFNGN